MALFTAVYLPHQMDLEKVFEIQDYYFWNIYAC